MNEELTCFWSTAINQCFYNLNATERPFNPIREEGNSELNLAADESSVINFVMELNIFFNLLVKGKR